MRKQNQTDEARLLKQWAADVESLNGMIEKMQSEVDVMQKQGAPEGHIILRQEMIAQYETTISKLNMLIVENG